MAYSFNVSCEKELHERFTEYCFKNKLKVSTEIRKFMELEMKEDQESILSLKEKVNNLQEGSEKLKKLVDLLIEATGVEVPVISNETKEAEF